MFGRYGLAPDGPFLEFFRADYIKAGVSRVTFKKDHLILGQFKALGVF